MEGAHATVVLLLLLPCCHSLNTFSMPYPCKNGARTPIDVGSPHMGLNSTGILKLKHMFYEPNMNCSVLLSPQESNGITIVIQRMNFRTSCVDGLTMKWSKGAFIKLCGDEKQKKDSLAYSGLGTVTIQFHSGPGIVGPFSGFEIVFTSYKSGPCRDDNELFRCGNRNCISSSLRCDGYNHCGDRSDQNHCHRHGVSMAGNIAIVLGFAFFAVIVSSAFVFFRKRRRNVMYSNMSTPDPYVIPSAFTAKHNRPTATVNSPPESYQPKPPPYDKISAPSGYK